MKSLGATHIIDRQVTLLPDLPSAVKKILPTTSSELKVVFDAVGSTETQDAGFDCLVTGGELITVNSSSKGDRDGKTILAVFGTVHLPHGREFGKILYKKLPSLIEHDVLVVSTDLSTWEILSRIDLHLC